MEESYYLNTSLQIYCWDLIFILASSHLAHSYLINLKCPMTFDIMTMTLSDPIWLSFIMTFNKMVVKRMLRAEQWFYLSISLVCRLPLWNSPNIIQCNDSLISDRKTITSHEGNIFPCWTNDVDAMADPGTVPTINLNQIGRIHNLDSS